ncbi:MAG: hypothetical protein AB1306_11825 [Nitrospirota bacterium]
MARTHPLQCPFCDNYLARPADIDFKSIELTGGICRCGAVYVLDRTGHNLGEIYLDALGFLCRGDLDKSLSLGTDDYDEEILDYNFASNTTGRGSQGEKAGKLLFVKLKAVNN